MSFDYERTINLVNDLLGVSGGAYQVRDIHYKLQPTGGFLWELEGTNEEVNTKVWNDLKLVRDLIKLFPLVAYVNAVGIVLLPTSNQFDILKTESTNGANRGFDVEEIIEQIAKMDAQFGVDIVAAGFDFVEFDLRRKPTMIEIPELDAWVKRICPDHQVTMSDEMLENGEISLWWD